MQKTQKINSLSLAVTKSCQVTLAQCWNSALAAHFISVAASRDGTGAAGGRRDEREAEME